MAEDNRNASSSIRDTIVASVLDTAIKYVLFPALLLIVLAIHAVCSVDSPVRHFVISIAPTVLSSNLSSPDVSPAKSPAVHSSPTPTVTSTPTPIPIATATPRPKPTQTPTPTPPPTPTPTPTPTYSPSPTTTVEEVRGVLISLWHQSLRRSSSSNRDSGLKIVVSDAVHYGQYDIALGAAKQGSVSSNKSSMLVYVARCMAREGWFDWARHAADHVPNSGPQKTIRDEIFNLEHRSLRNTPPPLCRQVDWVRAPQ